MDPSPRVVILALTLTESIVKNCGPLVLAEVSSESFMNELEALHKVWPWCFAGWLVWYWGSQAFGGCADYPGVLARVVADCSHTRTNADGTVSKSQRACWTWYKRGERRSSRIG